MIHTSRNHRLQGFGSAAPVPPSSRFAPAAVRPHFPSYQLQGFGAFGKMITIDTPFGPQKFNIPIENLARDAALMAVEAAWPAVQQKLYQELPIVVNSALDEAQPRVRKEVNYAVDAATSRASLIASALAAVFVVGAIWVRRGVTKGR